MTDDRKRYEAALHAMQSGVKFEIETCDLAVLGLPDKMLRFLKHERVGVNSALCDSAALAQLLISKGIITEAEYFKAQADFMESEKKRYEDHLSKLFGKEVTLG